MFFKLIILMLYVLVPSNPRHIKTKEKSQNIIQWSEPEVPSGRVEFYQVAIMVWYKDVVQRQHISNVVGSKECVFHLPVCIDADYRFTLQVRAVNAAKLQSEVDRYLFATWNVTTEYSDSSQEAAYYTENEDLKCEGIGVSSDKQRALLKEYTDSLKYVQYKSVWEKGPVTNCSDAKLSRITMMALLVVVSSLGVMAAFYVARNKYQKMANISCALPPGLEAMTHTTKNDDRGDFRRSKDSFYNNESRHLLSSISHDSGYICHTGDQHQADGVGIEGITSGSLGKSSGYMGSDHSTQYCTVEAVMGDSCLVEQTQIVDEDYMDMERLKQNDNNLNSSSSSIVFDNTLELPPNNCGYVDVNNVAITALSGNIPMKPHNIFNIPTQKFPPTTTTSPMPTIQTDSTPSMYDSGYFAPQRVSNSSRDLYSGDRLHLICIYNL